MNKSERLAQIANKATLIDGGTTFIRSKYNALSEVLRGGSAVVTVGFVEDCFGSTVRTKNGNACL